MRSSSPSLSPPNRRSFPTRPAGEPGAVASSSAESSRAPMPDSDADHDTADRPRRERPWLVRFQLVTGILVVMAASVLVAWGLRRYLHKSPRFAIATISIDGNHRLTPHQIEERAGLATGDNIFNLDEERAQASLLTDPWIESARVQKELPDAVHLHLVEREPRLSATIVQ